MGGSNSATVTIIDDDVQTVTITASDSTAAEAGLDPGVLTVSRTGSTASALTVNYTITGTATNGTDYQPLSGSVMINAGQSSATITVTPIDDSSVEGNETVIVTLSANANYTVGVPSSATVIIGDNDGTILTESPTSVAAGGAVTATWSGIVNPTAKDWIGLYTPGASNSSYQAWIYVSCTQGAGIPRAAGSCPFGLSSGLTPGTYELRLLSNDGFTALTTSAPFTVGSP